MGKLVETAKERNVKVSAVTAKLKPLTIGQQLDRLHELRERKRELQKEIDKVEADFNELRDACIAALGAQGLDKGTGKFVSGSISKIVVPDVKDWDQVYKYVGKTGYFHLFERRIAGAAFKELLARDGEAKLLKASGIASFTKTNLNLRNI